MSVSRSDDFRESVSHALAGAAASAASMLVFYPLETIRLRMQIAMTEDTAAANEAPSPSNRRRRNSIVSTVNTAESIVKTEGVAGFYMGLGPTLFGITVSQYIYFFLARLFTQQYIHYWKRRKVLKANLDVVSNMMVSGAASFVNAVLTCPLWVIVMRLKVDREHRFQGMLHCGREIVKDGGLSALYQGLVPSLWLICTPIVQYVVYEQSRQLLARWIHPAKLQSAHFFVLGGMAKLAATLTTYPMQVVQAIMTTTKSVASAKTKDDTVVECLARIFNTSGFAGLYRGLTVKLWQTVLSTALMFCAYEYILAITQSILAVRPPRIRSPKRRM
jgi:adenine nucleotide transporter 17